jgi:hypothetical protein
MEIQLTCRCGAEMNIQDGSEDRVGLALAFWFANHECGGQVEEVETRVVDLGALDG